MATMPGLRPLGLGEILDVGIKLYTRNWRTLMSCVVLLVLPMQIVSVLVTLSLAPEALDPNRSTGTAFAAANKLDTFVAAQIVIVAIAAVLYTVATAACFNAVADAYLGIQPSARRSLGYALRRLPWLLLMGLLATVGLFFAALALLVPAIWLSIAWCLAIPVALFERAGPVRSLRRSFRLVRGRWWPVAGTLLVGVVLVSFLGGALQLVFVAIPALFAQGSDVANAFANVIGGTLSSVVTTPFTAIVISLLYFDQRVRKEGFDLELLAEGIGAERPAEAALPAVYAPPEVTAEQRAQAPYWPPPPGWTPPPTGAAPGPPGGWTAPSAERPAGAAAREPESGDRPPPDDPPAGQGGGWEAPRARSWPPEPPDRGPGGL